MSNNNLGLATEIIIMAIVISVILLFAGIGFLVIIHVCIVGRRFRNSSGTEERGNNNSPGRRSILSKDDIEKLPSYDFIAKSIGSSPVDCAVCLDNFKVGDKCRLLPKCKHSFHAQCVDEWILKRPICPICRTSADSRRQTELAIGDLGSSHFSDFSVDIQTTEFSSNLSEASTEQGENSQRIEMRETLVLERSDGIESTLQQTNFVGTQMSSLVSLPQPDA